MPFVSVKKLEVKMNGNVILDDINFDVEKGEITCVIGPNGSGKTTLIKAMLGLIPFKGEVFLDGYPIKKHLNYIGYVPQRFDFDRTFPMTVKEFLNLSKNVSAKQKAKEICRELQVSNIENKRLGDLSGGQLQRVLIAQAIIKEPKLLILDEPTSGVDMEGSKNFHDIVRHLNEHHQVTIILISHEVSMVYKIADNVVCVNRRIVCAGNPKKVINQELLETLYGNEFALHIHEN